MLKILKLHLFCLPTLVDSCSHKLFAHKIPMHRKWVRLKCASHILHDALFMLQFLSFMWASLKSSCLAKKAIKKSACWETTQYLSLLFLCVHMIMLVYWSCFIAFVSIKCQVKPLGSWLVIVDLILLKNRNFCAHENNSQF